MRRLLIAASVIFVSVANAAEPPLLYLPLDGDSQPAIAAGPARWQGGLLQYAPGVRGMAARLDSDCRLAASDCMRAEAGTIACWLRPLATPDAPGARYVFCRYGDRSVKNAWQTNRVSVTWVDKTLAMNVYPAQGGRPVSVEAAIDWPAGQWRHLAATWRNVNSGRADAELCLYVDGRLAARRGGLQIDVGPMSDLLDIGRDSDSSPDYARADCDEFYIYGRALAEAEIRRAVDLAQSKAPVARAPALAGKPRPDWWNDAWPLRCRVEAEAEEVLRLPLDLGADVSALGLAGRVDLESLRVVPCDAKSGKPAAGAKPLPSMIEDGALVWRPGATSGSGRVAAHVYFDVLRLDAAVPLWVTAAPSGRSVAPATPLRVPDYATDAYGDAWDFDEGDFEEIDGFGNRSYGIQNRAVRDGKLCFDVCDDPYLIWGDMWQSGRPTRRTVAIDVARYPILAMKIRQSCAQAKWEVFGRSDTAGTMHHTFTVTGTGWQVVRVDLAREARFGGTLAALRIDPTNRVHKAHVEIDWIRLLREAEARREPVETLGEAKNAAARLAIEAPRREAPCNSVQTITLRAADAAGKAVAGLPVSVRLAPGSGGRLTASRAGRSLELGPQARRALTDERGCVAVELQSSLRAGPGADVIEAEVDFQNVRAHAVAVAALAGTPHHYAVEPARGECLADGRFPRAVSVQVVDEFGNPLRVAGREVQLTAPDGGSLRPAVVTTDAQGRAASSLAIDPGRRWVYWVEAADGQGLTGRSASITVALDKPRPATVRVLPNGYFAWSDGRPFIPLGGFYANWVQQETPDGEWGNLQSFTDTTDAEKLRWMEFLKSQGVTAMRMMLRTHRRDGMEPMDVGGRVNQALLAEAMRYMDLGRRYGLQFQLVLHEDYTKPVYFNAQTFERYGLSAFAGEDLDRLPPEQRRFVRDRNFIAPIAAKYTDPDAIACQDRYVAELLPALKNNPQVFAYELENEMVNCPADWAAHAMATLRKLDPRTPICVSHGGGGLFTADPAWWHGNTPLDFYNFHLYPHGTTLPEVDYGAAVAMLVHYGRMSGPSMLGESAGDQFRRHPSVETRRWVMRDIVWMSLAGGAPGVFFWNARGPEVREFRFAREVVEQLEPTTLRRAPAEIAIDVRHPMADDKWYRTAEGHKAYAMLGRYVQHYLSQGVDFDFTLQPERYTKVCRLERFEPAASSAPTVRVGPGWQLARLARDDGRALLAYVRNYAGSELWECPGPRGGTWRQYLRRREAAPLRIEFSLPCARYRIAIYDLDRQEKTTRTSAGHEAIDLGRTDHDYVIVVRREE